ncbi:MAG: hypothetical protein GX220_01525 [Treponema sp.]|nr:hypothetical protein [Treponema sp.]
MFLKLLVFFIAYAFLGWCLEVAYAALNEKKFVNRGFLFGPICPIYGFGAISIILILYDFRENSLLLFFSSIIIASLVELIGGWILNKLFNQRWWDYTDEPFNIGGYVCLKFSILWGIACVFVVDYMHPFLLKIYNLIPETALIISVSIIYAILLADIIVTVQTVLKLNKKLKYLNTITEKIHTLSNELGLRIAESTIKVDAKVSAIKENVQSRKAEAEAELHKLIEEKKSVLKEKSFAQRRIFKSFPKWTHKKYKQAGKELKEKLSGENEQAEDEI